MKVHYTAGKNIPLTDYLSRHPITYTGESETEADRQEEEEAQEEFVYNQVYGLFDFNRTIGSITEFIERTTPPQQTDQSQRGRHTRAQNRIDPSLETSSNGIKFTYSGKQQSQNGQSERH